MTTAIVTGGHSGLGLEASTRMAAQHVDLVLCGRDPGRVEAAAANLRSAFGVRVDACDLDVSSLESVRAAASRLRSEIEAGTRDRPRALLCNAGVQFQGAATRSADGYEETFATNYLGHFLFVLLMLDTLADDARIVLTVSGTHDPATMDGKLVGVAGPPDAIALSRQGQDGRELLSGGIRYTTSKLCLILFAYELARRLQATDSRISVIAFDPGLIPETGLSKAYPRAVQNLMRTAPMKALMRALGVTMGSIRFSGASLADVTLQRGFPNVTATYLQSRNGRLIEARSSKASYDTESAANLWRDSESLVHSRDADTPARLKVSSARQEP